MIRYYTNSINPLLSPGNKFVAVCDNEADTVRFWECFAEWRHYLNRIPEAKLARVFIFTLSEPDPLVIGPGFFVLEQLKTSVKDIEWFDSLLALENNYANVIVDYTQSMTLPYRVEVDKLLNSLTNTNTGHKCIQGGTFIFGKPICKICGKDLA